MPKNLDVAARDARIVITAFLGGRTIENLDLGPVLMKRLRIEGTTLRSRDETYQGKLRDLLEERLPAFERGELKVIIDKVLPWEEVQEGHRLLEDGATKGKVVLTIT